MPDRIRRQSTHAPPEPSVKADRGSIAAGRDINFYGLDEDGVRRVIQEELARVAEQKGVPIAALRAVLEKLGAAEIAIEEIPKRLAAAADELLALRQDLQRLRNAPPELTVIREHAMTLVDAGKFDAARGALNQGREAAHALREEASRNEAEFLVEAARIDHLELAYREAAAKYAEAAALVARFDRKREWYFLTRQASELVDHGYEFGENQALTAAIAIYRRALALAPRTKLPARWAMTQDGLGCALQILGERECGAQRLEEAVVAHRETLKELTRQRVPLRWALSQNNLGHVLWILGRRKNDTERLEQAVTAFHNALEESTRERDPFQWAMIQHNLGIVLAILGERGRKTERLEQALAAFRNALKEFTRERRPLQWAMTQNCLGGALRTLDKLESGPFRRLGQAPRTLGDGDSGTTRIEQALAAHRDALKEATRERVPILWAGTQHNLGLALEALGGTEPLKEAVAAYRNALKEFTRERTPRQWAITEKNLYDALDTLHGTYL
jgi:tetratricopeptide (TPR) repeat protein